MDDDFLTFYHGGAPVDFNVSAIDIFYPAIKQQNKAGHYVGFYMFGEDGKDEATRYAFNQKEAMKNLLTIRMKKDVQIVKLPPFSITRITREQIEKFREDGYDLIAGSSVGKMEYVLINKDKIIDMKIEKVTHYKQDKETPQVDPPALEKDKYATLEELEPLLSESGYLCFGHGTGRMGNSEEVVDSIFDEGLRTKDNSLYFTTIGLSTPTPELKKQYEEMGLPEPTIDSLKTQFNNWQHQVSKKIIIARIPTEYVNMMGDRSDLDGEMYGAFMIRDVSEDGKFTNYLNPKFIIGSFDVDKQLVKLNPHFEKQLSPETISELSRKYIETLKKTKARVERTTKSLPSQNLTVTDDAFDSSDFGSFDANSFDEESEQDSKRK